jgi:PST family polysaccharide transporter
MDNLKAYRQILRASSIIGGASVANILIGLIRTKIAAVLMGPAGIGLVGILQSLMSTSSVIATLGIGNVGTRQIAEASTRDGAHHLAVVRFAIFSATVVLALGGSLVFWLMREQIARHLIGDVDYASQVGILALGVGLMVVTASQNAWLTGLQRLSDLARVAIYSAATATLLGTAVLFFMGKAGVFWFVICAPLCSFLIGRWYISKSAGRFEYKLPFQLIAAQWKILAKLGFAFTLAALIANLAQLGVRAILQRSVGEEELGNFQAAAQISMTYLGLVLSAMGTDYYPRLTKVIGDRDAANQMINQQTSVSLLLGGALLLGMMAFAPWIIQILYSKSFLAAGAILRWHVLGDLFKLLSWPLGFILLAAGDGKKFFYTELIAYGTFVLGTTLGLSSFGVVSSGIAFLSMYIVYVPVVYYLAWRRTRLVWDKSIFIEGAILLCLLVATFILSASSQLYAAVFGAFATCAWMAYGCRKLVKLGVLSRNIARSPSSVG